MLFFPMHIGDWAKSTMHLSHEERGIYLSLLVRYYDTEQPLPPERIFVYRLLSVRNADAMQAVDAVLAEFFTLEDDGFHNKRADEEITRFHAKSDKARDAANARWAGKSKVSDDSAEQSEGNADAMQTHSEGNAIHYPLTNNHKENKHSADAPADKPASVSVTAKDLVTDYGISKQHAAEWLAVRKEKRAKLTKTAMDRMVAECQKAGMSLNNAVVMCIERSWAGFKAEYVQGGSGQTGQPKKPKAFPGVGQ